METINLSHDVCLQTSELVRYIPMFSESLTQFLPVFSESTPDRPHFR